MDEVAYCCICGTLLTTAGCTPARPKANGYYTPAYCATRGAVGIMFSAQTPYAARFFSPLPNEREVWTGKRAQEMAKASIPDPRDKAIGEVWTLRDAEAAHKVLCEIPRGDPELWKQERAFRLAVMGLLRMLGAQ